jgi:hypothetical protein
MPILMGSTNCEPALLYTSHKLAVAVETISNNISIEKFGQ